MIEAGVFYGRSKSHTNPRMKSYILHNRNGMEIFNLHTTVEQLTRAMDFLKEIVRNDGIVLLVATQPAFADFMNEIVSEFKVPAVTKRWIGGLLTNFPVITNRVNHLKKLRTDLQAGALEKYTKKERVQFEQEMERLEAMFGTVENMARTPDVMVVIDPVEHATAVREAKRLKIPVIAFANVDANPDEIDYVVPGNNKGRKSVAWFVENLREALSVPRNPKQPEAPLSEGEAHA